MPVTQYLAAVLAGVGLVFSSLALGYAVVDDEPPAGPDVLSAEEAAASGNPTVLLGEMYIAGDLSVPAGSVLAVVNEGAAPHNLHVEGGPATPDLNAGEATNLDLVGLAPDLYTVFCSIEGHRAAGMEAELEVT